jgi:acetylornithine/succinyldiaminopimelate/putrescine aminotransferase
MGKGMAAGLPIGAFTASHKMMATLKKKPMLGHITTFGGNPVIAAAALATLKEITTTNLIAQTTEKETLFRARLQHPLITEIRGKGLMLTLIVESSKNANDLVLLCAQNGLVLFWLLFEKRAVRITPPLTISEDEIEEGCAVILKVLNSL